MTIEYTKHLRADGERMAVAARRDLDAHVPTCPDWNVAKLVIHTGQHHRWVADAVRGGGETPAAPGKPGLRGDELIEWFRNGWSDLADLLDESADDTPAWSWSGDNRVGFWRRRTALETLVHRWDAENATGKGSRLDAELATDGIDELLFVMLASGDSTYTGMSGRVRMTALDASGSWTLDLDDGTKPTVRRDADNGAVGKKVTLSAGASDLLLFAWGRLGPEALNVEGDRDLFDAFLAYTK
jgi:uncharacterized protein (TIGR03083 family)